MAEETTEAQNVENAVAALARGWGDGADDPGEPDPDPEPGDERDDDPGDPGEGDDDDPGNDDAPGDDPDDPGEMTAEEKKAAELKALAKRDKAKKVRKQQERQRIFAQVKDREGKLDETTEDAVKKATEALKAAAKRDPVKFFKDLGTKNPEDIAEIMYLAGLSEEDLPDDYIDKKRQLAANASLEELRDQVGELSEKLTKRDRADADRQRLADYDADATSFLKEERDDTPWLDAVFAQDPKLAVKNMKRVADHYRGKDPEFDLSHENVADYTELHLKEEFEDEDTFKKAVRERVHGKPKKVDEEVPGDEDDATPSPTLRNKIKRKSKRRPPAKNDAERVARATAALKDW